MDYTIVTAWYDVREKENHPQKDDTSNQFFCSPQWYFDSAKLLFEKPFPMVIFTEPKYKAQVLEARPKHLHHLTRFIYRDYEELANFTYFKSYEENHQKNKIQNVTQEKFTALYKFIVNQKVNFVKDTIMMNPFQTEKFAWMDMRLHCVYDMSLEETTQVMKNIPKDKVKLMQMSFTAHEEIYGRHDFYSWTRGKVAAGFFGGAREPLLQFIDLCQKELLQAIKDEMAPTDEMIYSHVIAYNINLFDPYIGDYGFCLKNLLRTRGSTHLVFPFLQKSFDKGLHGYTQAICNSLRSAYKANELQLSAEDVHKTWYYNYVAHFWLQNRDECYIILNEYYEIAKEREDVRNHIKSSLDFLQSMIQYMGDENMTNKFNEFR
jgi:Bacterial protein of unknown function (HtrL_YibB)